MALRILKTVLGIVVAVLFFPIQLVVTSVSYVLNTYEVIMKTVWK